MWDLWWTEWHWDRFFLNTSISPAIYHSTNGARSGTVGPFVAIAPRSSVSLHPNNENEVHAEPFIVVVAYLLCTTKITPSHLSNVFTSRVVFFWEPPLCIIKYLCVLLD
jgi:hypothetical protein